jgi:Icc-related predicted phosphoesterase
MVRLVYSADLHGNLHLYQAAGKAAKERGADAVIFGGDLCPGEGPITRLPRAQAEFLLKDLGPMVRAWKREQPSLRVFAIPGNDDFETTLSALETLEKDGLIENLHRRAVRLEGYNLVGLSFVPPTPFSVKDFERRDLAAEARPHLQVFSSVVSTAAGVQYVEDFQAYLELHSSIEEELDGLDKQTETAPQKLVAVIHCPPADTRCDMLPRGEHIGSQAVRRWIERRQPLLTLHGHIHESPRISGGFCDTIGVTRVVNPGSDKRRPQLVFIDLENLDGMEHSIFGKAKKCSR